MNRDQNVQYSDNYHLLEEYEAQLQAKILEELSSKKYDAAYIHTIINSDGEYQSFTDEDYAFMTAMEDMEIELYDFAVEHNITPLPTSEAIERYKAECEAYNAIDWSEQDEAILRMEERDRAVSRHAELIRNKGWEIDCIRQFGHPVHYTIDDTDCRFDYWVKQDGKNIGLMLDTVGTQDKRECSIQRHIDSALDYVQAHNIPALFVYLHRGSDKGDSILTSINEEVPSLQVLKKGETVTPDLVCDETTSQQNTHAVYDNDGAWEIYLNGSFLRIQREFPTPAALKFDFELIEALDKCVAENRLGTMAKTYHTAYKTALKAPMDENEQAERLEEIDRNLDEIFDKIDIMQESFTLVINALQQIQQSEDFEADLESIYPLIDTYRMNVPNIAQRHYKRKAQALFPQYSELTVKSRAFLITAVAMFMTLPENNDGFDQAPALIELARVIEHELVHRIRDPYLKFAAPYKRSSADNIECFHKVQKALPQKPGDKNGFLSLNDFLNCLIEAAFASPQCTLKRQLQDFLSKAAFNKDILTNEEEVRKSKDFFDMRNLLVHPNRENDTSKLQNMRAEMINATNSRIQWIVAGASLSAY